MRVEILIIFAFSFYQFRFDLNHDFVKVFYEARTTDMTRTMTADITNNLIKLHNSM